MVLTITTLPQPPFFIPVHPPTSLLLKASNTSKKHYNTFNMLPEQVQIELNFTEKSFNEEFVSLDISHEVLKCYGDFN